MNQPIRIGILSELKVPTDNRTPLSPEQCVQLLKDYPQLELIVAPSSLRCFDDQSYSNVGIPVHSDLSNCDILLGVKEVPSDKLIPNKTYLFFSHTKKKQAYNQVLMQSLIAKHIRMIDYECLTHEDEQRVIGFGLFAGIVGAHNTLKTYGEKFNLFHLPAAHQLGSYQALIETYHQTKLPPIKIALTGSGKVAAGMLEIMAHLDIDAVEPKDFLNNNYPYPVYTHLKGASLYAHKENGTFNRNDFHHHPQDYECLFAPYTKVADILMNGIYWDAQIDRLFEISDIAQPDWTISVIGDVTCDENGSVPINLGASTIADPVYGIDRVTFGKVAPFLASKNSIDVMAVDNLPNELAKDASQYFGAQLMKFILPALIQQEANAIIDRGTMCAEGKLTKPFEYLSDYAYA